MNWYSSVSKNICLGIWFKSYISKCICLFSICNANGFIDSSIKLFIGTWQ